LQVLLLVRRSKFGILLFDGPVRKSSCSIDPNIQDLILYDVHGLTTVVKTEDWPPIYTISKGWGEGLPVQAPTVRWAEPADSRYRGKVVSTHASRRRWAEPEPSRAWEFELYRSSVLSASVLL